MSTPPLTSETESVSCDLCGSRGSNPLYRVRDIFHDLPGEFVLQRCRDCGLIYLSPRPTAETIEAYYPPEYSNYRFAVEDDPFFLMRWMRRRKLARRRDVVRAYSGLRSGRLLDVGASTGLFLHEMAVSGWETAGVEPVESAAQYARQRFGLEIFEGELHDAPYALGSFDVVTFWDVLEHTFSPALELQRAGQLLRPGGTLFISVPNWDSLNRALFGPYWQGLDPPRHFYVFTSETLGVFLAQAGFKVLDRRCLVSGYFSTTMSVKRWLKVHHPSLAEPVTQLLGVPGLRFLFEPWFTVNNWLRKGPIVTVIARKDL